MVVVGDSPIVSERCGACFLLTTRDLYADANAALLTTRPPPGTVTGLQSFFQNGIKPRTSIKRSGAVVTNKSARTFG
ncbi:hypothetical protein EVAR_12512_1 [Eumeta japonica]|uniref:Uncharacterized protein n=1 Tax=Eumeta variegata TaxID=151549 RepID=A0A4C1TPM6_EUMVA|nr:hypothetical protein EVAR_12512_1 [Eumeta japonica]